MARPKGALNRVGASAKENILAVFTRLGGTAEMAKWAKENQTEFYKIYARLIPTEVSGKVEHEHVLPPVPNADTLAERLERHLSNRAPVAVDTVQ